MINLSNYLLDLELPKKAIYLLDNASKIDIFDEFLNSIENEKKNLIRDALQFYLKYSFISPIVLGMIESDLTFMDAFNKRDEYIMVKVEKFKRLLDMANGSIIEKMMFDENMCGIIAQAAEMYDLFNNTKLKRDGKIYIEIQNVSRTFCYMVQKSGIELIINEVIENENIKNALENNIVNPLNEITLNKIKETRKNIKFDENLVTSVRKSLNDLFINLPIQFVLSIILTECINEDIPPSEVACSIKFENIFKDIFERITDYKEVSSIIEYLADIIQII